MITDHSALLALVGLVALLAAAVFRLVYQPLWASPLAAVPGPWLFALTPWRLALEDWRGTRTRCLQALHARYGPAVRIGPRAVSFASLPALRAVYGAGSGFERTAFYRMFDVYGRQNLFTFAPARQHAARKKLVAHAYAKTAVLRPDGLAAPLVARNVRRFLDLVDETRGGDHDVFRTLHWFSLDSITGFLYGAGAGGTDALRGCAADRRLLDDILHPARRRLSWFAVHLPRYTAWLYGRTGLAARVVAGLGLLPMPKPATYTAIRGHALRSWTAYEAGGATNEKAAGEPGPAASIMERLDQHRQRGGSSPDGPDGLDGLAIASELADHFLAGIDTTSDTAMFALWALSRPEHARYQARLRAEVAALAGDALDAHGQPTAEAAARLPFLDAVLRETLRLYAPLPASEPRQLPPGAPTVVVDGVPVAPGTTVSMDPYTLHRNAAVFADPLAFRPERWLGELGGDVAAMRRWFWAFSSGARMCIGMHLAMLEMTMLLAAVYRRYATRLPPRQQGVSPGIDSRFEVFSDSTFARVSEHECWITFEPLT